MMKVRGSEVQDFLRCRTRWSYRWRELLTPTKRNDKLFFGTMFHYYLELLYKHQDHNHALNQTMQRFNADFDYSEELDDLQEMLPIIADNYYTQYASDLSDFQVVATELQFEVPLTHTTTFTGTIDLILKDADDNLWFVDHKTTNSIEKYEKNAIMDRQINRYWWAIQQLADGNGKVLNYDNVELQHPYGFIYNIILKDYPTPPKVLKSGGLSKDKSQKTTYEMYLQAIREYDLQESDYSDILEILSTQTGRYFKRVEVFRNQNEIDATMREVIAVTQDMEKPSLYRNITNDCHWDCQFKDLCLAEIDGSDSSWLKQTLYEKGEDEKHGIDD